MEQRAAANLYAKCRRQVDKRKQQRKEKKHEACIHSRRHRYHVLPETTTTMMTTEGFFISFERVVKMEICFGCNSSRIDPFNQQHQRLPYKVAFMNPSKVGSTLALSCASHLNWILTSQRIKIRTECLHFSRCNIRTFKSRALNNDSESFN